MLLQSILHYRILEQACILAAAIRIASDSLGAHVQLIQAIMRTLQPQEEQGVSIHQIAHCDEKGNFAIVEIPVEGSNKLPPTNPAVFFFPSFWIQRESPSSCNVVALYR